MAVFSFRKFLNETYEFNLLKPSRKCSIKAPTAKCKSSVYVLTEIFAIFFTPFLFRQIQETIHEILIFHEYFISDAAKNVLMVSMEKGVSINANARMVQSKFKTCSTISLTQVEVVLLLLLLFFL